MAFDSSGHEEFQFDWDNDDQSVNLFLAHLESDAGAGIDLLEFSGLADAISGGLNTEHEHNTSLDRSTNDPLEPIHPSIPHVHSPTPVWIPFTPEPPPVRTPFAVPWVPITPASFPVPQNQLEPHGWDPMASPDCIGPQLTCTVPTAYMQYPSPEFQAHSRNTFSQMNFLNDSALSANTYSQSHPTRKQPRTMEYPDYGDTQGLSSAPPPPKWKGRPPKLGLPQGDSKVYHRTYVAMRRRDSNHKLAQTKHQPARQRKKAAKDPGSDDSDSSALSSAPPSPSIKKKGRPFKYEQTEDRQRQNAKRVRYYHKRKNEPAFREQVRQYVRDYEQRRRENRQVE